MIILVADDEAGVRKTLQQLFEDAHEVILCENGSDALAHIEKSAVDLVITDHQMPKLTGLELIEKGKAIAPRTSFLLMTAFGSVEGAVKALRLGAEDYVTKPFDLAEMEHRVSKIAELRFGKDDVELRSQNNSGTTRILGKSAAIRQAKEFVSKVADAPSPVLLLGPSGSGKEVLAKSIHESGNRKSRTFVAINCASLSEQLMESELFGHEKGAFTGATTAKPGKFELAKGGTLFLDEIGELSANLQAKLLRVLQEKEFYRLGGTRILKTDARVIAATHRPLKEMVSAGTFREDLFFRLNVLSYLLPPLRDRSEDIPELIQFFWTRFSQDFAKKAILSSETIAVLEKYSYPGNVRELQNTLERLMVLATEGSVILPDALPPELIVKNSLTTPGLSLTAGLDATLEATERKMVEAAMEKTGQNQVKAAELLKITRGALQYKLKKYGLSKDDNKAQAA